MPLLYILLGGVLTVAGTFLADSVRRERAARVGAALIALELEMNRASINENLPVAPFLLVTRRVAYEGHIAAVAAKLSVVEGFQVVKAYDAVARLEQWALHPETSPYLDPGKSIRPAQRAIKEALQTLRPLVANTKPEEQARALQMSLRHEPQ